MGGPCGPDILNTGVVPVSKCRNQPGRGTTGTSSSHSGAWLCAGTHWPRSTHLKVPDLSETSSATLAARQPNHAGLTAEPLFFLEESCKVKRSDTQTFSNFSNARTGIGRKKKSQTSQTTSKEFSSFKNVLPASPNKTSSAQTHK